jgi:predicted phosphohydrolase
MLYCATHNPKRVYPWVQILHEEAQEVFQDLPVSDLTQGNNKYYSNARARILNVILPSLFVVAQAYKDHVERYRL